MSTELIVDQLDAWLRNPGDDTSFIKLRARELNLLICVARGKARQKAVAPDQHFGPMVEELVALARNVERQARASVRILIGIEGKGNLWDLTAVTGQARTILNGLLRQVLLSHHRTPEQTPSARF